MAKPELVTPRTSDEKSDLGFGNVVARESRERLLNRDGTFNVERRGFNWFCSVSPYHTLLTMSWMRFLALIVVAYLGTNVIFGEFYLLCGPDALLGDIHDISSHGFLRAFFFSVQTFATIGYGQVAPSGLAANLLVTAEALLSMLFYTFATGLLFARFSRPTARIIYSEQAVVAPYRGITAFEFRIANSRKNQIIELQAKVIVSRLEDDDGRRVRRFHGLSLERDKVAFFPLSWTIVHPIDESSPLYGVTEQELLDSDAEFLILLTGIDETFSQMVHSRSSYKATEVTWRAKFADIFNRDHGDNSLTIDIGRLHNIEMVEVVQ